MGLTKQRGYVTPSVFLNPHAVGTFGIGLVMREILTHHISTGGCVEPGVCADTVVGATKIREMNDDKKMTNE